MNEDISDISSVIHGVGRVGLAYICCQRSYFMTYFCRLSLNIVNVWSELTSCNSLQTVF